MILFENHEALSILYDKLVLQDGPADKEIPLHPLTDQSKVEAINFMRSCLSYVRGVLDSKDISPESTKLPELEKMVDTLADKKTLLRGSFERFASRVDKLLTELDRNN